MPLRGPYDTTPMPTHPRTLAERLRWLRKWSGLTQVELSQALGCEQAMVSSWELARTRPTAVTLGALARHYGITLATLDTGVGFMEEALRRTLPKAADAGPSGELNLTLPSLGPGQVLLVDNLTGHQTPIDASEAMATLLRALKQGRKVWVVVK